MNISSLKFERDGLLRRCDVMLNRAERDGRGLTADEQVEYDAAVERAMEIKNEIDNPGPVGELRTIDDGSASFNAAIRPLGSNTDLILPARRISNSPMLRHFGDTRRDAEASMYRSGQWIAAQLYGNARAQQWCHDQGLRVYAAASEGVNTLGGHLVPEELDNAVISIATEYGVARQEARIRPMGSDSRKIAKRVSGPVAYFVGEGATITESDKAWTNIGLSAKKLAVLCRMSSELNEDAVIDLAQDFTLEAGMAFAEKEDDCCFSGTGASTYGGISGVRTKLIDGTHNAGKVAAASGHDTFAELDADDFANLVAAVPSFALRNAKWYVSRVGYSLGILPLIMAAGGLTASDVINGPAKRGYLGYEIVLAEKMPTSTGSLNGVVMILFGDMRQAVEFGDRRGTRVMLSEHTYFAQDQIAIRATERFDIVAHNLGDNTTAGSLVGLVGTS
jgi:HK97 family phage major capsid protein